MPINPVDAFLNSASSQPTSNNSSAEGAMAGIATVSILAATGYGIYYVYRLLTDRPPLREEDLERYRAMVTAYKKMNYDIFSKWELKGNKTIYCMNYPDVIHSLDETIHQLFSVNSPANFARAGILSLIKRYLESIDKRNWWMDKITSSFDRPDGVEALFLCELTIWLQVIVPNTSEIEVTEDFEKRIAYCKEVLIRIAKNNSHNEDRTNFKDFLERLISELENYHKHLIQCFETANFNKLINDLGDSLLSLSVQSFQTLHLMIRGVNQENFLVPQFVKPYDSDNKVLKLRNLQLGDWLFKTLSLAGITHSTFESHHPMSLEEIKHHLEGTIPGDGENIPLIQDVLNQKWGHWEFVTKERSPQNQNKKSSTFFVSNKDEKQKLREKAIHYLKKIRELHRMTLQFYYIRRNLLRAATVASVFGEIWIYGDKTGKAVLEELLVGVFETVQEYKILFHDFWTSYFKENYVPYAKAVHQDDFRHPCHNWLNRIEQCNQLKIEKIIKHIGDVIGRIRMQSLKLPETLTAIKQTKIDLFSDLLEFLIYRKKTESKNFDIISQSLESLKKSKTPDNSARTFENDMLSSGKKRARDFDEEFTSPAEFLENKKVFMEKFKVFIQEEMSRQREFETQKLKEDSEIPLKDFQSEHSVRVDSFIENMFEEDFGSEPPKEFDLDTSNQMFLDDLSQRLSLATNKRPFSADSSESSTESFSNMRK